ncbi:MAG: LacI family DNA-binding transcriptional regulator [Pleomorphochaeta sp.]
MSNNITIKDIAAIAGVSYSTVSRCLNDSPLVSEKTKYKVNKIAKELDFEFNANARGLITSKANTIAIVLPEGFSKINISAYHNILLNSLRTNLEKRDVDLIVTYQINHYTNHNNIIRLINRKKIDGLILLIEDPNEETIDFIKNRDVPSVFVHYPPIEKTENFDIVYTDHYEGGKIVAKHLLKKGHKHFTVLAVDDYHKEFKLRETAFCDEIIKNGGTINKLFCSLDYWSGKECVESNIDSILKTTAIFGLNDLIALGAMRALNKLNVKIPHDISIVGYDNSEFSEYANPSLTTIHQPREELALFAVDKLFRQINNEGSLDNTNKISIKPVLIERDST